MDIKKKKVNKYCTKFFAAKDGRVVAEAYVNILNDDKGDDPFCIINKISLHDAMTKNGASRQFLENIRDFVIESGCCRLTLISEIYKKGVNRELEKFGFGRHGVEFRLDIG